MNEIVHAEKAHFPLESLCHAVGVSRSGYYAWLGRRRAAPSLRQEDDKRLSIEVKAAFEAGRGSYGRPRIQRVLAKQGRRVGANRLRKQMSLLGLVAKRRRQFKRTTDSNHDAPIAPNLLGQNFHVNAPNRVWCADITYVRTVDGWLYLAVIVDLFARKVVGYAVADHMRTELTLGALEMALARRTAPHGLVHHSDRGSQYAAKGYRDVLKACGATVSMSRAGDCYDNAVVESFNDKIKQELLHHHPVRSAAETRSAIVDYIEMFYNSERLHSTLGYVCPNEYEDQHNKFSQVA